MHNHVAGPNNDVLRNRQSKKDRDPWSFFFLFLCLFFVHVHYCLDLYRLGYRLLTDCSDEGNEISLSIMCWEFLV